MVKRAKKWLALGLSVALIAGLAACGGKNATEKKTSTENKDKSSQTTEEKVDKKEDKKEDKKDPVSLDWWYYSAGPQADTEKVEAAFNELLQTYTGMEHVSVNFNTFAAADFKNAVVLAQSASEQMDILSIANRLSLAEEARKGTFLALDTMLTEHVNLYNELPEWLWDMAKVDDATYIVPGYQRAANMNYMITPKEWMDKYGDIDAFRTAFQTKNIEQIAMLMEDYLLAIREGEGIETRYLQSLGYFLQDANAFGNRFDTLSGNFIVEENSGKVVNRYITDDTLKGYEISGEWYDKGYIYPDVLLINEGDYIRSNMMNEVSYVFMRNNSAGDEETVSAQFSDQFGLDVYAIQCDTEYYIANSWAAGGTGITATCEHPEEAMRLLEIINTEEGVELYNMMVYGIEGVHYEKIDDTHIRTFDYDASQAAAEAPYGAIAWAIGNSFHKYLNQGCLENENEIAMAINNDPTNIKSDLLGYVPKTDIIATQLEQITAVQNEYVKTLYYGVEGADWKVTYDEFIKKMEAAGLNEVLTELQGQVDAFLGK